MEFSESEEFKKEFKKLAKKYPTLGDDLAVVKKAIIVSPTGNGTKHWSTLKQDESDNFIMKMRVMCRSVRGSQFRLVYFCNNKKLEVLFIELYYKGSKEREDTKRIDEYFSKLTQT
jgi:mRNA-degrading endonuclease RelE of RelBE toxin-antitoxin system